MTKQLAEIKRKMLEARSRLAEIIERGAEAKTDEERSKADHDFRAAERELAGLKLDAEIAALDADTGQPVKTTGKDTLNGLTERVSIRTYMKNAIANKPITEGAEHELNTEFNLGDGIGKRGENMVPMAALEVRADANTAAPATGDAASQRGIVDRVFPKGVTRFLGVESHTVPSGQANYMILTGGASPTMRTRAQKKESEAASLTGVELQPRRLAAAYRISIEDIERVGPEYDPAIRRDLSGAMMSEMDDLVINSSSNPQGILAAVPDQTVTGSKDTFESSIKKIADALDGTYASALADIRSVVGTATGSYLATLLRGGNAADQTAYEWIMRNTGGLMVTAHMPAAASNIQECLQYRTRGIGGPDAVAAVWDAFSLIVDPYSNAQSGIVGLTACMLWDFRVLRSAAYRQPDFKLA